MGVWEQNDGSGDGLKRDGSARTRKRGIRIPTCK